MRGDLKSWWGKLTDDDFEKIGGKKDRLLGMLQEKYGYTREAAQQEIDRRFRDYDPRGGSSSPSRAGQMASGTAQTIGTQTATPQTGGVKSGAPQEAGRQPNEKSGEMGVAAEEMTAAVSEKAGQSMSAVGEKIGSLAEIIRERAPHEGAMGSAATTVANKLDAAGSYLQGKDVDHMMGDLTGMIRRYPIPALLIGLGIGYLLAGRARR
jgi:uncharacterized protein YjbJ (UPF0337 family)